MQLYGRGIQFDHIPDKRDRRMAKPMLIDSIRQTKEFLKANPHRIRFIQEGFIYGWKAYFDKNDSAV